MSRIGLVQAVSSDISHYVAFGGAADEGRLVLNVDVEKLSHSIADAVTDYIKKEH